MKDRVHVAIIMDGNGRWAMARGLPRAAGHYAGVSALREVVEKAPSFGIDTLTVYAFSADNWQRPREEVSTLMSILATYLENELASLVEAGVKLTVIGRRDRLTDGIPDLIKHAERVTRDGARLHLRIAIDYSSRDAILAAAEACGASRVTREEFSKRLAEGAAAPDVDLLIRTSGEKRLSDFLLWEVAYAELYFTDTFWPDFGAVDLQLAMNDFRSRQRRFGGLPVTHEPPLIEAIAIPPKPRKAWHLPFASRTRAQSVSR